jgi:NADH-dependent peroxiredoxin subunit C
MSLINTEVQPFKATAYKNGKFIEITEANFKGQWSVVFFYPADFTFVCPTELEDLQNGYGEFQRRGVEIYSVSTDTHFSHKAWHDTSPAIGKIEYIMVGDPTHQISRNFEVMIEDAGVADRGTFVIDPNGKIQVVEITAGGIGRDAAELLRKIKAAQYVHTHPGEVCPAAWKEGEQTLAPSLDLIGKI